MVAVSEVLHLVALAEEGVFEFGGGVLYVDAWVMVESVCHIYSPNLCFFECTGYFAEGEFISVVDGCCFIRLQALAVDACGVGAIQVGDCVGAADMFEGGVYA